jgi:very-short-patch-repair endonuclease
MDELVLVGIVPRIKDWELLKTYLWYRIPVASAPQNAERTKYLAFYQPKCFGDERYSVGYYGKVEKVSIVRRIELLPDEPYHKRANKEYHKFILESLQKLPHPIPSRRQRRIVFISTTLKRLLSAAEVNDLYHESPIEEKMYAHFRNENIQAERQLFIAEGEKRYCLDFGIFCKGGRIDVECNGEVYHSAKEAMVKDRERNNELASYGWTVLRFSGSEIMRDPKDCIKKVKRTIKQLKGLEQ